VPTSFAINVPQDAAAAIPPYFATLTVWPATTSSMITAAATACTIWRLMQQKSVIIVLQGASTAPLPKYASPVAPTTTSSTTTAAGIANTIKWQMQQKDV
jgi:hypothetical protein